MDYAELIQKQRPELKPNSLATYTVFLRSISPDGATTFDWLYDTEFVLKRLQKYKDNTKKTILNAVIIAIDKNSSAHQVYTDERDKYNTKYTDFTKSHKKTASQEKNWIEWDDYLKMVKEVGASVKDLRVNAEWTINDLLRFQKYVLVYLYSHYQFRNDFGNVEVIGASAYRRLKDKTDKNYLVVNKASNKYKLILNEYKTFKKFGSKTIDINTEVAKVLRKWLKHNTTGHLLIDKHKNALGSNGISKTLADVGMTFRGKRLGSSLLRHSYLSHKYGATTTEKQEDASKMMHSVEMQDAYIKT